MPRLGDDCYLGPGAKVYGGVVFASGTKVGPNAVVCRSFEDERAVLVAPHAVNLRTGGSLTEHAIQSASVEPRLSRCSTPPMTAAPASAALPG